MQLKWSYSVIRLKSEKKFCRRFLQIKLLYGLCSWNVKVSLVGVLKWRYKGGFGFHEKHSDLQYLWRFKLVITYKMLNQK